jgi:hypothetical protein
MAEEEKGYTEGAWSGLPAYWCTRCPFDTLDRGAMEQHQREVHGPPPPVIRDTGLLDQRGRRITRAVQVTMEG